jgi:phage shock protein E
MARKIVDVRSRSEFRDGHIKGALNIPLNELKTKMHKLGAKNAPILVCCQSGGRSSQAARILKENGFTQVKDVGPWTNLR